MMSKLLFQKLVEDEKGSSEGLILKKRKKSSYTADGNRK